MRHVRLVTRSQPVKAIVGIGWFEKVQIFLLNLADFFEDLFGGGAE